jgi:formiminoglutamase
LGASTASNTESLFERAREHDAECLLDIDLFPWRLSIGFDTIAEFENAVDRVHLSIDLDVLPAATMPAVSAPGAHGVQLEAVESLIASCLATPKPIAIDLVELNPRFDIDGRGAKVAARLAWQVAKDWLVLKEATS